MQISSHSLILRNIGRQMPSPSSPCQSTTENQTGKPHVSFIDAQGNMPERLVTHELLKRHLGYDITMSEFEEMEQPPPYSG